MKKIIFTLSILITAAFANAQNCYWHEDFDPTSNADSVTSHSYNVSNPGWNLDTRLFVSTPNSDSAYLGHGDTVSLSSSVMHFTGMNYILLSFDQICKIHYFDKAELFFSTDGNTWAQIGPNGEYTGNAAFVGQLYSFSTASYGDWFPSVLDTIPNNTWWHHETFDLSIDAAQQTDFYLKFQMYDANNDLIDTLDGWHLENICVQAAPCELVPPTLVQLAPIYQNISYSVGPFIVNDSADDQSAILNNYLIYTVNGSSPPDTVVMTPSTGIYDYTGTIPAVLAGDTVCYWFLAEDNSGCGNITVLPQHCFITQAGLSFPYCDDFDGSPIWTDSTINVSGSSWELGTPAFGQTTGAHSPPNAWDVTLNGPYLPNSECYLYSPVFDPGVPTLANARVSFWQNRNTSQQEDGVTLQYRRISAGGPWTDLGDITNGCGCETNWYTNLNFNTNSNMWDGSSGGWKKSDYIFPAGFASDPQFEFRFKFTSTGFTNGDGFSVDNFCFELPEPNDPGLSNTVSPTGNAPAGTCVPVTVTIHNYGSNNLDSTNVYYNLNGNISGPFLWSGPSLAPGEEANFTMPCDTILAGANSICSWVSLSGDPNHNNDTSCTSIFGIPTVDVDSIHPYCENFDGTVNQWFADVVTGASSSIWQLGTPSFGTTNSAHTPPNSWDVDLTSGYLNFANTELYSPFLKVAGLVNPYLSFWLNWESESTYDGVRLEYKTDAMPAFVLVNPPSGTTNWYNQNSSCGNGFPGPQCWGGSGTFASGGWKHIQADDLSSLDTTGASYIQFRFVFCSDVSGTFSGASLDDFCFAMPAPYDAGVTTILQPSFAAPVDSCVPVQVTIKNFGYNTLTSFNVYYSKDDLPYGNPVTYGPYLYTGAPIAPGTSVNWTLPVCDTVPSGAYNFCSWTQLLVPQTDGNFFNDTSCTQSIGVPTIPLSYTNSYCDNFENGNVGWSVQTTGTSTTNWELGLPSYGQTNSAYSPTHAWDINLTTPYDNLSNTTLYTPYFNFSQAVGTIIDFYANFNTSLSQDGVKLEYSIAGGPWVQLFNAGQAINWYNSVACTQAGWSGTSTTLQNPLPGGWAEIKDVLPAIPFDNAGEVQFRFTFCSQQFGFPNDGFSIDNFCLTVPVPLTAAPTSCHNTSSPPFIFPGQPISFDTDIKNKGTTALASVVAQLRIDGGLVASDTINYSPALTIGQSLNHVFSNTWVTIPGVHNVCNITSYPNQGIDLNPTDDTLCCSISVIDTVSVATSDYCPDFDSAPQWVTLNAFPPYAPTSSWTFGPPNAGFMTAAHSGTNAWKTGPLNGNYPNKDSSALFTPAFNIQVGRTYELSFWHEKDFEIYQDGGNVEYSTDFGGTWTILGNGGSLTWYDSWFVTALGGTPPSPGWSITLAAWEHPSHTICFSQQNGQMAYPVMFRFRFASDYSVNKLGWLIDDFCFKDIGTCPVGVEQLGSSSALSLGQNRPNPTNSMTSIDYIIPSSGKVELKIVNLLGQDLETPVDEEQTPGMHTVDFNTKNLSPGIYYYSLTFNKETLVKKMVITK